MTRTMAMAAIGDRRGGGEVAAAVSHACRHVRCRVYAHVMHQGAHVDVYICICHAHARTCAAYV